MGSSANAYERIKPDHPDVERIFEITRHLDWLNDHGTARVNAEEAFQEAVRTCGVDPASLHYAALQRSMAANGVKTAADLMMKMSEVAASTGPWLEGFIVGARYAEARAKEKAGA